MIRPYQQSDTDLLITIWLESSAIAHSFIDYGYWLKNVDVMRSVYLPLANTFVWADRISGEVKGFMALTGTTVAALFVAPSYQQAGIGSELIRFAKQKFPVIDLYVYCLNHRAYTFYRKHGFEIIETTLDSKTGEEQYHMVYRSE